MGIYRAQWFDPRHGTWLDVGDGSVRSNNIGEIRLPDFPSDIDWGLRLTWARSYVDAPLKRLF